MNDQQSPSTMHDEPALDPAVLDALRRLPSEQGAAGSMTDEAVLGMARPRLAQIRQRQRMRRFQVAVTAAAAVLVLGVFTLSRILSGSGEQPALAADDPDVSEAVVILREVTALFPNQIQAIKRDESGIKLTLADEPRDLEGPGVLIEIQKAGQVVQIITFGGQTIELMGRMVEVEADKDGRIRIQGQDIEWLSDQPKKGPDEILIKATVI